MSMEMETRKEGAGIVVGLKGRMDAVTAPDFEKEIGVLIDEGEHSFILDLSGLEYISSAGLRSILVAAKRLKGQNGRLLLASLQDVVREVFEISGFSTILTMCDTVAAAHEQLKS